MRAATLLQVIDGKKDLEKFSNAFINLALPFFGFSDPIAAAKQKVSLSGLTTSGLSARGGGVGQGGLGMAR